MRARAVEDNVVYMLLLPSFVLLIIRYSFLSSCYCPGSNPYKVCPFRLLLVFQALEVKNDEEL